LSTIPLDTLVIPAVILVTITAAGMLITQSATWIVTLLAMQYVGVFILVGEQWPLSMALSKLVAGWIAALVIGWIIFTSPQVNIDPDTEQSQVKVRSGVSLIYGNTISAVLFRLLAAILVGFTMVSASPNIIRWITDISIVTALGGMMLIGLGLLQLGLSNQPLRVVIGLLTVLSGFEILYSAVEISALVAGLLTAVTMSLAVIGAYFVLLPGLEETQ